MTLQQLEYITAVYRCRHFGKAAEECGVTQPTLSTLIQKLETELGAKLFERSSQQVLPTAIGVHVVRQAQQVLSAAKRIPEIVSEEQQSVSGTFRLAILPTIAPYLLPRLIPLLGKLHPEIELRVVEMKTAELRQALERDEVDAAVAVNLGDKDNCVRHTLYYEQFIAYVSKENALFAHPSIRVSDLTHESLWLLDEGHCFREQLVKFCRLKAAHKSQQMYSLGSIETFMRMVENGQGVTFIPELALEQLTPCQKELVRPFCLPIPVREVTMLTTKHFVRQVVLTVLEQTIRASVPPRMLTLNNTEQRI